MAGTDIKSIYERLGNVVASIKPRNERARTWLDKLIYRCIEDSRHHLDKLAIAASFQELNHDFEIVLIIQGDDVKQKPLYSEVERLLMQLEQSVPEFKKLY